MRVWIWRQSWIRLSALDIVGDQDVDVELLPREHEPLEPAVEHDVAVAIIAGVDILIAARIVELRHAAVDDPVA